MRCEAAPACASSPSPVLTCMFVPQAHTTSCQCTLLLPGLGHGTRYPLACLVTWRSSSLDSLVWQPVCLPRQYLCMGQQSCGMLPALESPRIAQGALAGQPIPDRSRNQSRFARSAGAAVWRRAQAGRTRADPGRLRGRGPLCHPAGQGALQGVCGGHGRALQPGLHEGVCSSRPLIPQTCCEAVFYVCPAVACVRSATRHDDLTPCGGVPCI